MTRIPTHNILFILLLQRVTAVRQNVTIDDYYGDPTNGLLPIYNTYSSDGWVVGNISCAGCLAHPSPSLAYNGTWHDSTTHPGGVTHSATILFNGSSVYVYCIIVNAVDYTTLTNMTFTLDGNNVGSYFHAPNTTAEGYQYNVPVYVNESIPDTMQHTLIIQASPEATNASLILFDYVTYTVNSTLPITTGSASTTTSSASPSDTNDPGASPQGRSPTSSHSTVGALVGSIVGGMAGFLIAAVGFWFVRRKTKNSAEFTSDGNHILTPGPPTAPNPYYSHGNSVGKSGSQPGLHNISSNGVPNSSGHGYPAVGTDGDTTPINHGRSKAVNLREETPVQLPAREQELTNTQNGRDTTLLPNSFPILPALPLSLSSGDNTDPHVASQVADLQREVERLRSQMFLDINELSPPQYTEHPPP